MTVWLVWRIHGDGKEVVTGRSLVAVCATEQIVRTFMRGGCECESREVREQARTQEREP